MADDAGALLVRTGLISDQALLAARGTRASSGGTIGEQLVLQNAIADEALTEFYRARLLVPRVNPNTLARLSPPVIESIPIDMAIEFRCVPVSLDREGNLTVAMSDPSDSHAVDEIGFFTGKYVVRAVATQMQIAWCLAHYYGHITELGRRLLRPSTQQHAAPPAPASGSPVPEKVPRVRGFTGRIEASRHKALPPTMTGADALAAIARPTGAILTPTADDLARVQAAAVASAPTQPPTADGPQAPEPPPPAPAPAPPAEAAVAAPAAGGDSEPYSQVHVSLLHTDEGTPPRGAVQRTRPAEPDPPELAARSGEMQVVERAGPNVDAVPAVVVDLGSAPARIADLARAEAERRAAEAAAAEQAIATVEEEAETPVQTPVTLTTPATPTVPTRATTPVVTDAEGTAEPLAEVTDVEGEDETAWEEAAWKAARATAEQRAMTEPDAEETEDEPAVIHDAAAGVSEDPILLTSTKRAAARDTIPETDDDTEDEPVVLLDRKKTSDPPPMSNSATNIVDAIRAAAKPRRKEKRTVVGVGVPPATPRARPASTGPTSPATPRGKAAPTPAPEVGAATAPAVAAAAAPGAAAAPAAAAGPAAVAEAAAAAPPAGARPWAVATPADGVPRLLDESRSDAATRPHISEPATPPDVDEGWGPPGTTIPPPFLGAIRGSEPDTPSGGSIPIAGEADAEDALDARPLVLKSTDSEAVHAPHLVAPEPPPLAAPQPAPPKVAPPRPRAPVPVEPPPSAPISAHLVAADPIAAARALEAASTRLVELLRLLDRAHTRDEVISALLDYLHRSHDRVAFFASKSGALSPFLQRPASAQKPPSLPLETPSTLQDVVGTRLPYRGHLADDASRHFIAEVFGSEPAEVLILPISVRDRVVAVLYGDGGHGQSFDEHFAIAGRAAGLALERILQAKRAATQP